MYFTKGSITIENQGDLYTFDGGATWVTSNTLSNLSQGEPILLRLKII